MTIPGGSALEAEHTVHITPPKVDTPLVEVPMTQALAAQLKSKALNGNPANDDPYLLIFYAVGLWIAC
jgi:hypothetical protein